MEFELFKWSWGQVGVLGWSFGGFVRILFKGNDWWGKTVILGVKIAAWG
jgi:hypothetical protein